MDIQSYRDAMTLVTCPAGQLDANRDGTIIKEITQQKQGVPFETLLQY